MAYYIPLDALDKSSSIWYICSMPSEIKANRNSAYSCRYHVVFCPENRRKVLMPPIDGRQKTLLLESIEKWGQEFIEIEVMPAHVQLLLGCDPQFGLHRLVQSLKGASSRLLRQEFPVSRQKLPTLWTNSSFVATTGGVTLESLQRYVEGQKYR
jgi:putative transposase